MDPLKLESALAIGTSVLILRRNLFWASHFLRSIIPEPKDLVPRIPANVEFTIDGHENSLYKKVFWNSGSIVVIYSKPEHPRTLFTVNGVNFLRSTPKSDSRLRKKLGSSKWEAFPGPQWHSITWTLFTFGIWFANGRRE